MGKVWHLCLVKFEQWQTFDHCETVCWFDWWSIQTRLDIVMTLGHQSMFDHVIMVAKQISLLDKALVFVYVPLAQADWPIAINGSTLKYQGCIFTYRWSRVLNMKQVFEIFLCAFGFCVSLIWFKSMLALCFEVLVYLSGFPGSSLTAPFLYLVSMYDLFSLLMPLLFWCENILLFIFRINLLLSPSLIESLNSFDLFVYISKLFRQSTFD